MLASRDGGRYRVGEGLLWSVTWALGVAVGVAAGGWLTVTGGAGAPGAPALDPLSDLVLLPGAAFAVVFGLQVAVRLAGAALRGRAVSSGERKRDNEHGDDHGIAG